MTTDAQQSKERDDHRKEVCYASVKLSATLAAATFAGVAALVLLVFLAF